MKLKSFSFIISLLIISFYSSLFGEEKKIDIWQNQSSNPSSSIKTKEKPSLKESNPDAAQTIQASEKIQIQEGAEIELENQNIFGIYEPASYDLNLNMWSTTKAEDLRSSLKRLNKIELSKSSNEILEAILFSFSFPPKGMSDKEFVNYESKIVDLIGDQGTFANDVGRDIGVSSLTLKGLVRRSVKFDFKGHNIVPLKEEE